MKQNNNTNILIVDDRQDNLLVLESLLEDMECNIIKATSGNEALSLMLDYEFALVLLDVQMPEMDGFETAEFMRMNSKTRYVPIIFVTAISKEKMCIFKGYEKGAVDYLFKPIEPIILQSKVRVFLELYNQKKLVEEQTKLLELKLKELSDLKEANFKLENLSTLDGLTGISNRRSFDNYIETSLRSCVRSQKPISLIMADIDFFKGYNDNYGHLKGDDCLTKVANTITSSIKRPLDFAARYGGEEFAVILPETDIEGAKVIAEVIRKNVEGLKIVHEHSKASQYVTLSLGIATLYTNMEISSNRLIESADKALYRAKSNGRNIVST
ncbi:diguanylate cyclase domain-containing protein [Clostridium beijerinckii]|uniref:Stage 0 sporulation protein A homolog n=1 Tax=Clostridium beijerinckii TaxID=1520 RepID=A0A0B5QMI5_CLOBE|nr:diguanylate cyclase [Clostridium beijerinckii]AJG99456.1 diguanylate cyclase response regulator [Clostridium beijerinckii]MBA8934749.1 diguanylate cyclase (GGDEF)-like protein [Clostridium beijerinckii]NRT87499.1 diguanylate cyclase (GGDEF)-like protein [Clostridium beijerinckii]NRU39147.1 diguanylate cyclase (GGDEF)-like protein [Clostridium beijerinckii]NSA97574.1 diguanylate cyclase (GGDEF)-like protein [Clostridium beijerinckii]